MNQIIENIISNFNFERVHKAMTATNWKWCTVGNIPSIGELMVHATQLLEDTLKMEPDHSVSTGGFKATKIYDEEYGYGLKLEFILSKTYFYERETE